jgi:hypothetical protein
LSVPWLSLPVASGVASRFATETWYAG